MKSISLYELSTDLVELIDAEDVEINEEIKAEIMAEIENLIAAKSEGIVAIVKNYEATIGAIKSEEKRLYENRKILENKVSRLKEYTKECLERTGKKKVETSLGNISIRKTPPSVNILDETKIPLDYVTVKEVTSIDKKTLLNDLKDGLVLEGIVEIKQGTSLIIK